jgi:hypothetical protein
MTMKQYPGIRWAAAAALCAALLAGCGRGGILVGSEIDAPDPAPDAEADPAPDSDADAAQDTLPDPAGDPDVPPDGDDSVDAPSDVTDGDAEAPEVYLCPDVPPLRPYSHGDCPVITGGPTADTSVNTRFLSAGDYRDFRFLVPDSYDGSEPWPLLFGWHWLNASSSSFVREGELETAAEEMRMLVVLFDDLENSSGESIYWFNWPFSPTPPSTAEARLKEMTFFDDLLICIRQQYNVDPCRVHAVGVSAGGLWLTYLSTTDRVDYLASIEVLSGGLAEIPLQLWHMEYFPQANKFPALVLWGGPLDIIPPINFNTASLRYVEELLADSHFVVRCTHDSGHAMPPVDPPPDGGTRFRGLWQFFMDHPYGLEPGTSPYFDTGLPLDVPSWCSIASTPP